MRLFAGIPVPTPALEDLGAILSDLRESGWPVRWVRPDGLHLTLKFFGQASPEQAEALETALRLAAEGCGPIPMSCTTIGSFPPGRGARIISMGIEAPGALELLQDRVERACERLGHPVEGRPFRPHITFGRVKDGGKLPPDALARFAGEHDIAFLADRLVLFESRPGRGGSQYVPRQTVVLSPCPVV